jgi:hypothetical protein
MIPDPRDRRGRRHTLASVLAVSAAAVAAGARSAEEVVDIVYPDIDPAIRFAAAASAQAQLQYLRRESQAAPEELDPL